MKYRRMFIPGGTYFFTVVTYQRQPVFENPQAVQLLKDAFLWTKEKHPYFVQALVILPDHLHSIWSLPEGDANYPLRWNLIKGYFSKNWKKSLNTPVPESRKNKREREIWQRRYWEHFITDEKDFEKHINYVHFNPVKHGYVENAMDWEYSTIQRYQ